VLITYARLPAADLYHVTGSGLEGGLSRALVFANFPVALVAIPAALLAAERVGSRIAWAAAALAVGASAVVFWPRVVDQADLDAKAINAVPAVGVAVAIGLTFVAARRAGAGLARWQRIDRWRLGLVVVLVVAALPWIAADLGFSFDGVPVLGSIWQTGELRHQPGLPGLHPAIHHGHHHGMDGVLVAASALALARRPSRTWPTLISAYLALLFAYGLGNAANDFWLEQVAKRSWTSWLIPSLLRPSLHWAWAVVLAGAALAWLALLRPRLSARR
jgi:hypothetical protein